MGFSGLQGVGAPVDLRKRHTARSVVRSMLRIRNAFGSTVLPVLLRRVEETSESDESATRRPAENTNADGTAKLQVLSE